MSELDVTLLPLSKIDRNDDIVYAAAFLQNDDGIITVGGDRTVRVWLKRDSGHYWPTVCEYLTDSVLCMHYDVSSKRLFVGLANSVMEEFILSEDYNRLSHRRDFLGQVGRVRAVTASLTNDWLFSCGSSNQLVQHCLQSGVLLCSEKLGSWGMCLQFDEGAKFVFVGELSGHVTMLSATQSALSIVKRIQRHSGCISRLLWDPATQWLFSSSSDSLVCCWDFGGGTGDVFELRAHQSSVNALCLIGNSSNRLLLTCGDDGALLGWKMDDVTLKKRCCVPKWLESDNCQLCNVPFFWNLRGLWQQGRTSFLRLGPSTSTSSDNIASSRNSSTSVIPVARQHHCRRCGKAICGNCSNSSSTLPLFGFELPVRICSACVPLIDSDSLKPLCTSRPFSTGHSVIYMDTKSSARQLLTVGRDRVVKIWDASSIYSLANGR